MAFFLTCGTHTFSSLLQGYEQITCKCQNCGNFSGKVYKRWQWFTVCFLPLIPFSLKPWHEVGCHICNFYQDVSHRPDVQAQMDQMHGGVAYGTTGQQVPMQTYAGNEGPGGKPPPQQVPYYGGNQGAGGKPPPQYL